MSIQSNQIIGELVAQDYRTAGVFKKYGIDFCCQGNRTINDACQKKNIDEQTVLSDLNELSSLSKHESRADYQSWPIDLLTDYIEKKHHRYVKEKTEEIKPYLEKICRVHGDGHPELFEINKLFAEAARELTTHMKKEELILFPFIKKMAKAKLENIKIDAPRFETVENPVQMMMDEHTREGERFRKIDTLTNHYTPPQDACNTYGVTFSLLKEFEEDLHLHIHLEK